MSLAKKFFLRALLGIPIGIAISATISLIINISMHGQPRLESYMSLSFYIRSYIAAAIIGAVNGGGSVVWDVERWGWMKKSVIYFGMIFLIFYVCSTFAGWITIELSALLISVGIFIAIYIVISIVIYLFYKGKLQRVNEKLSNKRE